MNDREIRLECLRIAAIAARNPTNAANVLAAAQVFVRFVVDPAWAEKVAQEEAANQRETDLAPRA